MIFDIISFLFFSTVDQHPLLRGCIELGYASVAFSFSVIFTLLTIGETATNHTLYFP